MSKNIIREQSLLGYRDSEEEASGTALHFDPDARRSHDLVDQARIVSGDTYRTAIN